MIKIVHVDTGQVEPDTAVAELSKKIKENSTIFTKNVKLVHLFPTRHRTNYGPPYDWDRYEAIVCFTE